MKHTKLLEIIVALIILTFFIYHLSTQFNSIYENALYRGNKNAIITIVEFGDYGCHATAMAEDVMEQLLEEYRDKLKIIYLDFPHSEESWYASEAAKCAFEQEQSWKYHRLLLEKQTEWKNNGTQKFKDYSVQLGLNSTKFVECLENRKYKNEIEKSVNYAKSQNIKVTPTFFVNNIRLEGAYKIDTFRRVINFLLKK
jgi:protein-disulfide isomerase